MLFRQLNLEDGQIMFKLHNDPLTLKYAWVDGLNSMSGNLAWIQQQRELYASGLGLFVLMGKHNHFPVGLAGLRLRSDLNNNVDLVYRILPEYRQMGFAKEAAQSLEEYAFAQLKLSELVAQVHDENAASIHILNFLHFDNIDKDGPWILFSKSPVNRI